MEHHTDSMAAYPDGHYLVFVEGIGISKLAESLNKIEGMHTLLKKARCQRHSRPNAADQEESAPLPLLFLPIFIYMILMRFGL